MLTPYAQAARAPWLPMFLLPVPKPPTWACRSILAASVCVRCLSTYAGLLMFLHPVADLPRQQAHALPAHTRADRHSLRAHGGALLLPTLAVIAALWSRADAMLMRLLVGLQRAGFELWLP